ncbi:MAG: molecular chaperone GrpE [Patescibacteria group bacterium]|nr:molecular chaperone GrpE [Patescibacteria group bacterium]
MIKKKTTTDHNEDEFVFEDETDLDDVNKKIKKLRLQLVETEKEKMANLEGWQRAKADYSNLKTNTERDRQNLVQVIKAGLIDDFIPLADSFEMAMANKETWEAVPENWRKGIEYIYSQLGNILTGYGVETIDPLGKDFNPVEHESTGLIHTAKPQEDHRVLQVVKRGYKLGEKIIRPAQVKIGEYQE